MAYKVVITDYFYENIDLEKEILEANGFEVISIQTKDEEQLIVGSKGADAIINQFAPMTRKVIETLDNCKIIARYGIGYDNVDVTAASEKGVYVTNVPHYCLDEVAEHAITLLLTLARKVPMLDKAVKNNVWDYTMGKPINRIKGRTLGLVGFGNIAKQVASRAKGLGLEVLAFDPYIADEEMVKRGVIKSELADVLQNSDYVSVHVPYTKNTLHLIGDNEFDMMKNTALFINVARGPVVNEASLIRALTNGKIAGAAVDVLEKEPPSKNHPLFTMDNVIITPHIAYYSEESELELRTTTTNEVVRVLRGEMPLYPVNKGGDYPGKKRKRGADCYNPTVVN